MKNPCARLIPHWVSFVVVFLALVLPHVLIDGLGATSALRLGVALAGIAWFAWLAWRRAVRYRRLDELHQRIELESLATAFAGSFLVFVAYWLLQLSGVLPPLRGLYFMLVMLTLMNMGTDGAWQRILRRRPR